jgi:hypothetical protein
MERRTFLKLAGMATLLRIINPDGNVVDSAPNVDISLGEFPVAGFQYHEGMRSSVLSQLQEGVRLVVKRDRNNPHDPCAVMILTERHEMLGYLPRRNNMIPASLADQGIAMSARVVTLDASAEPWERLRVSLMCQVGDKQA